MASWEAFEAEAPKLAARGRQFFYMYGVGMGFLATVRRDGGPRVHPICPILTEASLFALIVPGPKLSDLRRDGRYALHCLTSAPPRHDDAFYIAGTVTEVTDAAIYDRVAAQFLAEREIASRWPEFKTQVLFEFDLERCLVTLTQADQELPAGHTVWLALENGLTQKGAKRGVGPACSRATERERENGYTSAGCTLDSGGAAPWGGAVDRRLIPDVEHLP